MADSKCICPVVEIKVTSVKHITDIQAKEIADRLNAQVTLEGHYTADKLRRTADAMDAAARSGEGEGK